MGFANKRLLDALRDEGHRRVERFHGFRIPQRVDNRSLSYRASLEITVANLHPHTLRPTSAVNGLRAKMPERFLMLNGGWGKIPDAYYRTLGAEDLTRFHREISPADRLGGGCNNSRSFWPTCGYYGWGALSAFIGFNH